MYSAYHHHDRRFPATRTSVHKRRHHSNGIGSQQYPPFRIYTIRNHFFSIGKKYTIYENGQEQYFVGGGIPFGGVSNLLVEDRFGTPLIQIEKDPAHFFRSQHKLLSYDGNELARIKQSYRKLRFEIDTLDGPYQFVPLGSIWDKVYSILDAHNQVIARKDLVTRIAENQDQAFLLASIIVINYLPPDPSGSISHSIGPIGGGAA